MPVNAPVSFSNPHIFIARADDLPFLEALINSAYRGERSTKGWTSEAHLIQGEVRVTRSMLEEEFDRPGSVFLCYSENNNHITGCVNLQKQDSGLYLGMFSVSPEEQGRGVGKALLQAAEEYAWIAGCRSIYMTVISLREELIAWYLRHGYRDTGKRKAFPEDPLTGKHTRPLEFAVLEKYIPDPGI